MMIYHIPHTTKKREIAVCRIILFLLTCLLTTIAQSESIKAMYVGTISLEEHLSPSRDAKVTNKIYKNQKVDVYEEKAGWSRVSEYYDGEIEGLTGKVARWVESAALVDSRMEDNQISPTYSDPRIEEGAMPKVGQHELSESDIRTLYSGAIKFLNNGRCSKIEYADKSLDKPGVYYVNCGDENVFFTSQDVASTLFSEAPKQNNNTDNSSGRLKGKKEFKYLKGMNSAEAIADPRMIKQLKKILSNKSLDALTYQANDEPVATDGRFYIIRTDSGGGNCADCGESLLIADGEDGTLTAVFYGDNGLVYKGNKANVGEIHSEDLLAKICEGIGTDLAICIGRESPITDKLGSSTPSITQSTTTPVTSGTASSNSYKTNKTKMEKIDLTTVIYGILVICIYLLPGIVANIRKHNNENPIALANLFFGWTGIGWLVCLIWALSSNTKTHDLQLKAPIPKEPQADTKNCPYCAEEIKQAAVICRFCGKEVGIKA